MLSEIFYTFLITSVVGLIIAVLKMAYKSKCKEVQFCCLKIVRDVDIEEKELEFKTLHKVDSEEDINHPKKKVKF